MTRKYSTVSLKVKQTEELEIKETVKREKTTQVKTLEIAQI